MPSTASCASTRLPDNRVTIVPTLRVGMPLRTLRVRLPGTQSVPGCIPTRSVGTIRFETQGAISPSLG
ncbi:hypothetical protein F7R20_27090 [Pseudomonas brassicacearum subsp. brassicacearum]|nr:hypothetical protein F7R20_27090 [Pseudomonas brassicacearum subsp. brassicacearum]PJH86529.1 hypothetical protein CVG87_24715 [Pseudomonas sp. WCS365]QEO81987.1 hypothetical protein ELZ14_27560 [Pseudomonas brassicacearum]